MVCRAGTQLGGRGCLPPFYLGPSLLDSAAGCPQLTAPTQCQLSEGAPHIAPEVCLPGSLGIS